MTGKAPRPLDVPSEHLLRELAPQVLGAVIRRFRDFAGAEDAVQEALVAAYVQWPREGRPENPRAWLIQVASRRMTDHLRRETARRRRETAAAAHVEQAIAMTPLKRMGLPEEIAESVLFLASDGGGYVTGQVLQVDGGWLMTG